MTYEYKRLVDQLHNDIDHDCTMLSKGYCRAYVRIESTVQAFEKEQWEQDHLME